MPNIRYVCLSDLHLGEEDSLLTDADDPGRPSPVLRGLADCLATLLNGNEPQAPKPQLILAGDVLELALCPTQQTLAAFEQFLRAVLPAGGESFGEVVYLPGNHDHHLWHAARESQHLGYLKHLDPREPIEPPWDTTKVVMDLGGADRLVNDSLTAIAQRVPHLRTRGFEILTAYPNFGVRDGARAVVFHHGHFIEPAYRLLSTIASLFFPGQPPPADVYTLERENSAWIDFFWSTLGSCGRLGPDIETIYEASADNASLGRLVDTLAHGVATEYRLPKWLPRFLREWLWRLALRKLAAGLSTGLERRIEGDTLLSDPAAKGLDWYRELVNHQLRLETGSVPESLAFVFGHTHKPFVDRRAGASILNTGGWVVDAPRPQPLHGAAVVLVGDDLSIVSLRCYNEGSYEPRVESPDAHGWLFDRVAACLRRPEPWTSFARTVRAEVELRADRLKQSTARLRRLHATTSH